MEVHTSVRDGGEDGVGILLGFLPRPIQSSGRNNGIVHGVQDQCRHRHVCTQATKTETTRLEERFHKLALKGRVVYTLNIVHRGGSIIVFVHRFIAKDLW